LIDGTALPPPWRRKIWPSFETNSVRNWNASAWCGVFALMTRNDVATAPGSVVLPVVVGQVTMS
jgi:hypothetical protein